jgi:hypothetical protein
MRPALVSVFRGANFTCCDFAIRAAEPRARGSAGRNSHSTYGRNHEAASRPHGQCSGGGRRPLGRRVVSGLGSSYRVPAATGKIQQVVVILDELRSFNNPFQGSE